MNNTAVTLFIIENFSLISCYFLEFLKKRRLFLPLFSTIDFLSRSDEIL